MLMYMILFFDLGFRITAAVIVVIFREVIKSIAAHFVMHPVHRANNKIETNLLKYIDPLGLIMFVLDGVGWQKPAEYTPRKFADKEKGVLAVSLAGFVANLLLLTTVIMSLRYTNNGYLELFLGYLIQYNIAITVVNLLPVPPLDMAKILYATSPNTYFKIIQNQRLIHTIFLVLLVFGFVSLLINPITSMILFALI